MKGNGPQYPLGLMDAEALLDQAEGHLELPQLRRQTARAIERAERNCRGPAAGSLTESKRVPAGQEVYPLKAINDSENASLWPTVAYLIALIGMDDLATYEAPDGPPLRPEIREHQLLRHDGPLAL